MHELDITPSQLSVILDAVADLNKRWDNDRVYFSGDLRFENDDPGAGEYQKMINVGVHFDAPRNTHYIQSIEMGRDV